MPRMNRGILIGLGVIISVAVAATAVLFWLRDSHGPEHLDPPLAPKKRVRPNVDLALLTHEKSIIGSWKRVALPEDEGNEVFGWRQINAAGKMATLYGDVIYQGSFKVIDKQTIETAYHCYGKDDEINRWSFGFLDGKLIMIHNEYGWVEAYESVPAGTLYPPLDP